MSLNQLDFKVTKEGINKEKIRENLNKKTRAFARE
jgi:hypothetical protein